MVVFIGSGNAPVLKELVASPSVITASQSSYTFSSLSFGAESPTRLLVACAFLQLSSFPGSIAITGLTIGGVAATRAVQSVTGFERAVDIWALPLASGTSGNVVVTGSTNAGFCGVFLYRLTRVKSDTASAIVQNSGTGINVLAGGVAIGASANRGSFVAVTLGWSGLTKDAHQNGAGGNPSFGCSSASIALDTAATPQSYSATSNFSAVTSATAAWR